MTTGLIRPNMVTAKVPPNQSTQAKVFLDEDDGTESWRYNKAGRLMRIFKGYEAFFRVFTGKAYLRVNVYPNDDISRVVKLKSDGSLDILFVEDGEADLDTIVLEKKEELIIETGNLENGLIRYRVRV